jgi:hypothetical protein
MKPGPIHKLKTIKRAMNSLTDQTTDMTQKSTTHVLKFLIPLTSSVEVYKPRNITVVFSHCG